MLLAEPFGKREHAGVAVLFAVFQPAVDFLGRRVVARRAVAVAVAGRLGGLTPPPLVAALLVPGFVAAGASRPGVGAVVVGVEVIGDPELDRRAA